MVAHEVHQAAARDEIHREIGQPVLLADFVDGHDVGVLKLGRQFGLGAEPAEGDLAGELAAEEHLEGDHALQAALAGLVHHAHAAVAESLPGGRRPQTHPDAPRRRVRRGRWARRRRGPLA